jgi:cytochrome c oxidase assembly protein Cox11
MRREIVGRESGTPPGPDAPALITQTHARWWKWILLAGVCVVVCAGWIFWRYTAPVQVRLASSVKDLPFDVETIPPVVDARPGEMVSAIYRIRNNDIEPLEAFGSIEIDPPSASQQIQVFLTQCGGLNTYEHSYTQDYRVFFRVGPAGLMGAQQITLRHNFTRAAPPRP